MKLSNLFSIILLTSIAIFFSACKGDTGLVGSSGPALTGNISGLVNLTDTNGVLPANKSGVLVSITGTSSTAITDSTGHWQIDNIMTGIYTIEISKATYGLTKIQNYQFIGGGTTYIANTSLSQVPNFQVSNLSFTTGNGFVDVSGSITITSAQTTGRNIFLFIGNSSNVSSNPSNYLGVVNAFANGTATAFTQRINTSTFTGLGIGTGTTAYIVAYSSSASLASSSRYIDQTTGRFTYTSLGNVSGLLQIVSPDKPVTGK